MRRVLGGVSTLVILATLLMGAQLGIAVVIPPPPANGATTSTALTVSFPRDLELDPSSGRVFVSGDDAIDVFGPDGARLATIAGVSGAGSLDVAGASLWATTNAQALAEIDLVTSTVVRTLPVPGFTAAGDLVVVGSMAFMEIPSPFTSGAKAVLAVDLLTGATQPVPGFTELGLRRASGRDDRVFVVESSPSSARVRTVSATAPFATTSELTAGSSVRDARVNADGTRLWTTDSGARINEWDLATGLPTLVEGYPAPSGGLLRLSWTPARGGLLAAIGPSTTGVFVYGVGNDEMVGSAPLPSVSQASSAFSSDGRALFWVDQDDLRRTPIEPSVSAVTPSAVVAATSARIVVAGFMLDGVSSVSVGGTPVVVRSVGPTAVEIELPNSVPAGVHPLVVSTPLGEAATTIAVAANVGATLVGTVRVGGLVASGTRVSVTGGALAHPSTTTTDSLGTFGFSGLPPGSDFRLEIERPGGAGSGQVVDRIALVPNVTSTVDIDLRSTSAAAARFTTVRLPTGTGVGLGGFLPEPTTGLTFTQKGSEVMAVTAAGDLVARFQGFGDPRGTTAGDGSVFVGSSRSGAITVTRIDPVSLAVTGEWSKPSLTGGAVAFAGDKLFVLTHSSVTSFEYEVQVLDLETGVFSPAGVAGLVSTLVPVGRDQSRLVASTSQGFRVLDVSGSSPVVVASADASNYRYAPSSDGPLNRLWTRGGLELELSTLTPTGRSFDTSGATTFSATHGGIVTFGGDLRSVGDQSLLHRLSGASYAQLNTTGDVAFTWLGSDQLAVQDLRPHIDETTLEDFIIFEDGDIELSGWGLRPTTSVTLDGVEVPFRMGSDTRLDAFASITPGSHTVAVTTPWGRSPEVAFTAHAVPSPPTITNVTPSTVPLAGGTVRLTGTGFRFVDQVDVGGDWIWDFTILDDSTIELVVPPRPAGTVNVAASNVSGWSPPGATVTYTDLGSLHGTVRDAAGPLAGMVVLVSPAGSQSVLTSVATGPDGSFTVPSLAAGSYRLNVFDGRLIFGLPARHAGGWYQVGGTLTTRFVDASPVPVAAASAAALDPIVLGSIAPGSISGTVTDGIQPLEAMVVLVSPATALEPLTYAVTKADGTFSIGGLAPGEYRVVTVDGAAFFGLPIRYLPEYYDDVPYSLATFGASAPVPVSPGAATALDAIELSLA